MVDVEEILASIKPKVRNPEQEARIRQLYDRAHAAYESDRTRGVTQVFEADWRSIKTKFDTCLEKVKKETGLY